MLVSISADLRRFRLLTMGKTVVLGRRTLSTFPGGRPLEGRTNLILSGSGFQADGAEVFPNLSTLFTRLQGYNSEQICVIGGESVYRALLPYCHWAHVTKTFLSPAADTFFPNLDTLDHWTVMKKGPVLEEHGIRFQYIDYVNQSPLRFGLI